MTVVAKCSAFVSLSYRVYVNVCNPTPLIKENENNVTEYTCLFPQQVSLLKLADLQGNKIAA